VDGRSVDLVIDDIDHRHPVFFVRGVQRSRGVYRYTAILDHFHKRYTLMIVPSNRQAKFIRLVPSAIQFETEAKSLFNNWRKGIGRLDNKAMSLPYQTLARLQSLNPKKINDDELRRAVRASQRDLTKHKEVARMFSPLGLSISIGRGSSPLDKYPLFVDSLRSNGPGSHVYLYFNAVYAARQEIK
jgi:hypothetical protein